MVRNWWLCQRGSGRPLGDLVSKLSKRIEGRRTYGIFNFVQIWTVMAQRDDEDQSPDVLKASTPVLSLRYLAAAEALVKGHSPRLCVGRPTYRALVFHALNLKQGLWNVGGFDQSAEDVLWIE